ncbi:MAG: tRNA preQ1(34) S-adenosylmethionine ribosyltransferase-isomerase QueA [Thermoanaerobaculia bacterium]
MLVADFDFDLPPTAIAQEARPRGTSRLLVVDAEGDARDRTVGDLPALLRAGDLVVVNDTRVIPARLFARRVSPQASAAEPPQLELLLVEKIAPRRWVALARPGRRARPGTRWELAPGLSAEVLEKHADGRHTFEFDAEVEPRLEALGHVPLPPYIARPDRPADRERYQTVWAERPGAIAAPTAGLHFTTALLDELAGAGIARAAVTLHVGIGTFKPVTAELVHEHRMESERYEVPAATAEAIAQTRSAGGRIVAIGTTVVRTLESAARPDGTVAAGAGRTELFVTPGFPFRVVDLLVTNFHLPRSTLLMMVAAFAGRERVLAAYRDAIARGYLFYSYGDAMLLARQDADGAPRA